MINLMLTNEQARIIRDCMVQANKDYIKWRDLLGDASINVDHKKRVTEIIDEIEGVLLPMVKDKISDTLKENEI